MTDDSDLRRLRGAAALLSDAVEHGTSAIERVHLATAARPFAILESIPPTALVARGVHLAHDAIASSVYATIRAVNHVVRVTAGAALDVADGAMAEHSPPEPPAPPDTVSPPRDDISAPRDTGPLPPDPGAP